MTTPELQPPARQSVDIAGMVQFVLDDPDWWRTAVLPGVCIFIPFVGPIIHLGWQRRMFHHVRSGGTGLLPLDFGGDLSDGVAPFVASLTTGLVLMVGVFLAFLPGLIITMIGGAAEVEAIVAIGMMTSFAAQMAIFPLSLVFAVLMLEVLRRGFHGELAPIFSPGESIARIRRRPTDYIVTLVGQFVANFIGSLGIYLCLVGGILTLPAGNAMTAHVLAQWDRLSGED